MKPPAPAPPPSDGGSSVWPPEVAAGSLSGGGGGGGLLLGQREHKARSLVTKSRKPKRALPAARSSGARLINCLSEYFASRNVINRSDRYEQMREPPSDDDAQEERAIDFGRSKKKKTTTTTTMKQQQQQQQQLKRPKKPTVSRFETNWQPADPPDTQTTARGLQMAPGWLALGERQPSRGQVKKFHPKGYKCGACELLRELLVGGRQTNKLLVLVRLLKTPVVLAALFSFCLALSLISLYALSFHHCQLQQQLAASSERAANQTGSQHSINSRHLDAIKLNARAQATQEASLVEKASGGGGGSRSGQESSGSSEKKGSGRWPLIETECGAIEARPDGAGLVFGSIPYASPPLGERRWRRPQAIWLDEKRCKKSSAPLGQAARSHCVQLSPFNRRVSGSEDCLYLDVYAPQNATTTLLPVMFYIHGGFLAYGSKGAPEKSGQLEADGEDEDEEDEDEDEDGRVNWMRARPSGQLASELNVLLVAANFRLQALGFMALEQLAEGREKRAANFGLWDQLVALNWVWRNIGQFGGDRNNINLFGPDAASALPLALVTRRPTASGGELELGPGPGPPLEMAPGRLLRSVWLMDPSLYFDLPRERANRHYARLIKSQSICSSDLELGASGSTRAPADARDENNLAKTSRPSAPAAAKRNGSSDKSLRDCLMSLAADEVTREYLGKDDADFRLDDENSLPIRNIFPDQFVTLDGQLVQRPFPLQWGPANEREPERELGLELEFLLASSGQAVEFWPCPRNLHRWSWLDFERYVETSLNSFALDTFKRASELYRIPASSQPASEGANQTGSPAETYLSMVSDIRQICPTNELGRSLARLSSAPVGRYIVEWRPSERLARGLKLASVIDRQLQAQSSPPPPTQTQPNASARQIDAAAGRQVQFAFHHWDLLAFFGFHFERPRLEVAPSDLEFQRQLRKLVHDFVWRRTNVSSDRSSSSNDHTTTPNSHKPKASEQFVLFSRDGGVERNHAGPYKRRECEMWQQSLEQSYAWLS